MKEQVNKILLTIKSTNKDFMEITNIIEGGYLDSFELMALITSLCETFEVEIGVDEITPENFNSIEAMVAMIENLKNA